MEVDQSLPSDQDLVKRMLAGEERAFSAFFDGYFGRVYRFALPRLAGDQDAAKDVVQATLVKAIRHIASYRGDAAMFTWICQICRREIVDWLRAHRRYSDRVVLIEDSAEVQAALESIEAPDSDDPAHNYDQAQTRRLLQSVLDRLPPRYGDVLEWKYVEGCSVEEIGEKLGIGNVAAQSLLARARIAFRNALETVFGATPGDVLSALRTGG